MAGVNKAIILGRMVREMEITKSKSDNSIGKFSLVTSLKYKGEEHSEFHNCVAFGKTADIIAQYTSKGDMLYIEGRLQTDKWEKDGVKQSKTSVVVNTFSLIGNSNRSEQPALDPRAFDDSDIPF